MTFNQIRRHRGQPINLLLRPVVFDRNILAVDIAGFFKAPTKCGCSGFALVVRSGIEISDNRCRRLVRLHRKRPRCRNATNKADKFPSSHDRPLRAQRTGNKKHSTWKEVRLSPLWVKSRQVQCNSLCPLYPRSWTRRARDKAEVILAVISRLLRPRIKRLDALAVARRLWCWP